MTEAPGGSTFPPLPATGQKSEAERENDRGSVALFLAVVGLLLELSPTLLGAAQFCGRFAFVMAGIAGGMIAIAGLLRALPVAKRVPAARKAIAWESSLALASVPS